MAEVLPIRVNGQVFSASDRALATTAGKLPGALIRICLLKLKRPNTTVMSETETSNSRARNLTMWSVALPATGAAVTLILS